MQHAMLRKYRVKKNIQPCTQQKIEDVKKEKRIYFGMLIFLQPSYTILIVYIAGKPFCLFPGH